MTKRRVGWMVVPVLFSLLAACTGRPRAGGACTPSGALVCDGKRAAFYCNGSVYARIACKGRLGCANSNGLDVCDDDTSDIGDPCREAPGGNFACSTDGGAALECVHGAFAVLRECRGVSGCAVTAGHVACDNSLGQAGDACGDAATSSYVCSADRRSLLACKGGRLETVRACRGGHGCSRFGSGLTVASCDDSLGEPGETCATGQIACSLDRREELACKDGLFVKRRDCRGEGCVVRGDEVTCD